MRPWKLDTGGTGTVAGLVTVSSGAMVLGDDGSTTGPALILQRLALNTGSFIELTLGGLGRAPHAHARRQSRRVGLCH